MLAMSTASLWCLPEQGVLNINENKIMKKTIWLLLSSFGIMFAVLSWIQEGGLLPVNMGWGKGCLAVVCGAVLYILLPRKID